MRSKNGILSFIILIIMALVIFNITSSNVGAILLVDLIVSVGLIIGFVETKTRK